MAFNVTATQGGSTSNGMMLSLRVLTGTAAKASQTGAHQTQSGAAAHSVSITPAELQSLLLCVVYNNFGGSGISWYSGTSQIANITDSTHGAAYGSGYNGPVSSLANQSTFGSNSSYNGACAAAEIFPASAGVNTIVTDASTPAVASTTTDTAVSTASFAPPVGALLVALVACNGGGSTTMTMTDTSGLGLTWTALAQVSTAGNGYAGVWITQVPVGGSAVTPSPFGVVTTFRSPTVAAAGLVGTTIPVLTPMPAGYVVQPADMNALASACTFLLNRPMTKVRDATGGQSLTAVTQNAVTFTVADFDADGMWNAGAATRLTIQTPGFYKFRAGVNVNNSGVFQNCYLISTSGTNNPAGAGIQSNQHWAGYSLGGVTVYSGVSGIWPVYLYALDYIQLFCYPQSTVTQGISNQGSYLSMEYVSV